MFEIWGIWRPSQHLELVIVFLKLFLNHVSFVVGRIVLLKEATPSGNTVSKKGLDTLRASIHMNGSFPAERCLRSLAFFP